MALSDLQVFQEYAYSTMTEVLPYNVDLFNTATRGGIILRSAAHQGDFSDVALWAKIQGLVRRRNAYGAGAVAEKVLQQLLETSVKVAAGTPPVRIDPGMLKWIQQDPAVAGATIGKQMAADTMADMLNTAIIAYVAAVGNIAALYTNKSTETATLAGLNAGRSKLGDRASDLACWIMHSKSIFDIYGQALTNANFLFNFGTVKVMNDGFGNPLVISDAPSLVDLVPNPDNYFACGLMPAALMVDQNNDFTQNIDTRNGEENLKQTYQAEWSYNVGLKGFSWDKTNGGKSPTDAALGTATNWDRYATSDKDLAGVLVRFM